MLIFVICMLLFQRKIQKCIGKVEKTCLRLLSPQHIISILIFTAFCVFGFYVQTKKKKLIAIFSMQINANS